MAKVYCECLERYIGILNPLLDGLVCPEKARDSEQGINCRIQGYTACQPFIKSRVNNGRVKIRKLEVC